MPSNIKTPFKLAIARIERTIDKLEDHEDFVDAGDLEDTVSKLEEVASDAEAAASEASDDDSDEASDDEEEDDEEG